MKQETALTTREHEVLVLVAEGRRNKEIATALCIATYTVEAHLKSIFRKLQVQTRTEAALQYQSLYQDQSSTKAIIKSGVHHACYREDTASGRAMLRYQQLAQNETKLLALTGLTHKEFQSLVPVFRTSFELILQEQTLDRLDRVGRAYTTYRNSPLPTTEDKLLFILVYLKQAPPQTLHGQLFGLSQSNAHKWIHLLHRVLNHALTAQESLPLGPAMIHVDDNLAAPVPNEATFFS